MKKAVALILAAFLTLSLLAACGGGPAPEPEKTTTGFDKFELTYFHGPQGYQTGNRVFWERAKEAGFTSVPIEGVTAAEAKAALAILKELGMTCSALFDKRLSRVLSRSYDAAAVEQTVKEVVDDYADYADVIKGWLLMDEPSASQFKKLGALVAAIKKVDPERNTFIDLHPNWASPQAYLKTADYQEYVDRYIAEVNPHYVCYDHYHFLDDGTARKGYFANFETIRKAALASDLDYMTISLLVYHGGYCDATFSQLLWEANMALCYGAKRISYFTFMLVVDNGEWKNACVDLQGNKMPHFDDVKAVISRVYNLGVELFNKRSEAVFHLTGDPASLEDGCAAYESYGALGKVTGDEFTIGFFSDGSFMIMNKKWKEGDAGKNSLVFEDIASGLQYFDVESASWKAYNSKTESGKYVYNAEAGEGLLFRVK